MTSMDSRSRRNRASCRGGQLPTRALRSSSRSACPHFRAPGASVRDGRTIRRRLDARSGDFGAASLIPVTNDLERLNGEIKRRTEVVGVFPNDEAIVRLVGAILLEQNDEWALQRARYMTLETMAALSDDPIVGLPAPWSSDQPSLDRRMLGGHEAAIARGMAAFLWAIGREVVPA